MGGQHDAEFAACAGVAVEFAIATEGVGGATGDRESERPGVGEELAIIGGELQIQGALRGGRTPLRQQIPIDVECPRGAFAVD